MPSRTKETESQPFLKYSDDPTTNEAEPDRRGGQAEGHRSRLLSYSLVFIFTSLFWLMALFVISSSSTHQTAISTAGDRHNITSNARLVTCGNSTQEAKARGCKYDILLNMWAPAQCADDDFLLEYEDDGSWGAFADKNMTQKLAVDEMSEADHYYTSVRDHINHCATMWKKQFWALFEERSAIDTMIASPGHTDHCAQYLMDVTEGDWTEPTRVERGFAGCWIRD